MFDAHVVRRAAGAPGTNASSVWVLRPGRGRPFVRPIARKFQAGSDSLPHAARAVHAASACGCTTTLSSCCRLGRRMLARMLRSEIGDVYNRGALGDALTPAVVELYKTPLRTQGWDAAIIEVRYTRLLWPPWGLPPVCMAWMSEQGLSTGHASAEGGAQEDAGVLPGCRVPASPGYHGRE